MHFDALARHSALVSSLYRSLAFNMPLPGPQLPRGPAIVLAAHYNGILDGFVCMRLSSHMLATPSAQWHATWLGRLLIPGVTLARAKDKQTGGVSNTAAFKTMQNIVRAGHPLLFFPEGTSRLGAERLPVQRGTALLLSRIRSEMPDTPVYFSSIQYENPTLWRSRATLAIDGPHLIPEDRDSLCDWVAAGLLRAQARAFAQPLPTRPTWLPVLRRTLAGLALLPVFPAVLAARAAIRRFADDTNVISLWRLLGAVPATLLCWLLWCIVAALFGPWWLALLIPLTTLLGVALWQS